LAEAVIEDSFVQRVLVYYQDAVRDFFYNIAVMYLETPADGE